MCYAIFEMQSLQWGHQALLGTAWGYLGYLGLPVTGLPGATLATWATWASLLPLSPSPSSPPSPPHTTSSHRGRTTRVPLLLTGAEPRDNQFFSQGSNDAITTSLGGVTGGDRSFRPRADLFIVRISTACLPIRYAKSSVSPTLLPQPSDGVDDHFKITRMPFPLVPVRVDVLRKL